MRLGNRFAPSSDLLAMLSRGVSLGSTDLSASTSSQSVPDGFNSFIRVLEALTSQNYDK